MKHFFIIAGGKIEDAFAIGVLKGFAEKTVIAADSGMEFYRRFCFGKQRDTGMVSEKRRDRLAQIESSKG